MKTFTSAFALAIGVAIFAGPASAQDLNATGAAGGAEPTATCDAAPAPADAVSATGGAGSDIHNLKVFACNGVRVGTAISTSKGPNGTILIVAPDANFLNGISTFEISAASATTTSEGEIRLAMTDRALRASIAEGSSAGGGAAVQ